MIPKKYKTTSFFLIFSVISILLFRFLLIVVLPLQDKTEARYAEISRLMVETKEWVVLQIDYGIPFWAKPPLSTWLSALSIETFGLSEMAVRLPSFLMGLAVLLLVGKILKKEGLSFYLAAFVMLTIPEFLLHMGVVSTDSALALSVVLIMLSFWQALQSEKKSMWGYLFFIAVGLGLLSKGPIVIVLTAIPLFIWCLLDTGRFKEVFLKLPWILGILILILISVPWYIFMEERSPGFLDYFVIGEHFGRFTEAEWDKDLYGKPTSYFRGMIWVFLLIFAFPWIQIVFYSLWKKRKIILKDSWISFLVLWLLWTPIFFTFSKNILHTYLLPVVAPIAILVSIFWVDIKKKVLILRISSIVPVLVVLLFFGLYLPGKFDDSIKSDKLIIENQLKTLQEKDMPIYYLFHRSFSGQYYSKGNAKLVSNQFEIDSVFKLHNRCLFVIRNKNKNYIPKFFGDKLALLESNNNKSIYLYVKEPISN